MKVSIQHASNVPDGQIPDRRNLAELEFVPREDGRIRTLVLPETPVPVDSESWLVLHSAYSPSNRGLSVMVCHHTPKGITHVFTGMATWDAAPYFAFRLPTGEFIEFYFQDEKRVA